MEAGADSIEPFSEDPVEERGRIVWGYGREAGEGDVKIITRGP